MKTAFLCTLTAALLSSCNNGSSSGNKGDARAPVHATAWTNFSGDRALQDVKALVELGPRPSGSAEIETSRQFIEKRL